ncbi:MAG TPA: prepilin-type cleavage/methylation domain-containing protein [Candidatus Methylomirabilis sp.]|nr:prepilin-type cleavage/methylation domain-containing protein [Candidatus Methylomirabilis sp.]
MRDSPFSAPRWPGDDAASARREGGEAARAITIVELLIAAAIVVTLAGIGFPAYNRYRYNADVAKTILDVRTVEQDIYQFEGENGRIPDGLEEVGREGNLDPWKRQYQFLNNSTKKGKGQARFDKLNKPLNTDFDLYSLGRDGVTTPKIDTPESLDDIVRALDGQYVGLSAEF